MAISHLSTPKKAPWIYYIIRKKHASYKMYFDDNVPLLARKFQIVCRRTHR